MMVPFTTISSTINLGLIARDCSRCTRDILKIHERGRRPRWMVLEDTDQTFSCPELPTTYRSPPYIMNQVRVGKFIPPGFARP